MADRPRRPDLLPSHATRRERAQADTDGRLDDIDADLIRRVRVVAEAPAEYLPYLAWQVSVDDYDPDWPEAVKRAVIAAAPEVHRHKGTVRAVEAALAALRVDAVVTEWWQETPRGPPHTFAVEARARGRLYADGPLLDGRLIRAIHAAVMCAKPLSRAFALRVPATVPGSLGLATAAVAVSRPRVVLHPTNGDAFAAPLGLAPAAVSRVRVRATMRASP